MLFGFFIKGFIIGISIAAPIGPTAIMCLRKSLSNGFLSGFSAGLGGATACTVYGATVIFGLTAISHFMIGAQLWIRLIGGCFLIYLGIKTWKAEPQINNGNHCRSTLKNDYSSTFFITMTSPMTLILFAAMCSGLDFGRAGLIPQLFMLVGIGAGGIFWWFLFTWIASLLRKKLTYNILKQVNRLSGMVIIIFALVAFMSVLTH